MAARYELHLTELIGKGEYASVFKCNDKQYHRKVAIKVQAKTTNPRRINPTVAEIAALTRLGSHAHIVSLFDAWSDSANDYLVLQYAAGGELLDYVMKMGPLPPPLCARVFRQIVSAVAYMHAEGFIHRDLKLDNIFIRDPPSEPLHVLIGDWGFSAAYDPNRFQTLTCGSLHYASPEITLSLPYVGPEVDVWSLGVILWALSTGQFIFDGAKQADIAASITKANEPGRFSLANKVRTRPDLPPAVADLVQAILKVDAKARPTAKALLKHSFLLLPAASPGSADRPDPSLAALTVQSSLSTQSFTSASSSINSSSTPASALGSSNCSCSEASLYSQSSLNIHTQSFSAAAHDSSSSSPSSSSSTLNNSNNDLQSAGTPAPTDACHSQPQAASSAGFRREMFRRQRSSSSSMVRLSNPDHFVQHPKVIKSRFRPGPDLSPDALREDSPAVPSSPLKIRAPRKHRSLKSPRSSRSPRSPRGTNSKSPRSHRRSDSSGRSGSSSRSSSKSRNSSLDPFQVAEDRLSKRNHKSSKPASGDVLRSTAPDALQQALRMRQAERSAIPLSTSEDFKLTMHLAHDGTFTPNEESSQRASASVSQPTHSVTPAPEIEKKLYASGGAVPPACSCSTDPPTRSGSLFAIVRGRSRKKAPPEAAASVPSVSAVTCTLLDEETMVSAHSSDSEDSPARDASPSVSTDHPARDSSPSVSASTEQPPKKRVANLLRQHLLGLFGSDNKRA